MSLGGLSVLQFLLGLGLLGAVLAVLQILRVRHREVPVATTLFWRQAIEETRARVFRHRFRHLGAWLLFLLIGGLLWLGFAEPRRGGGGEGRTICLLDTSAHMAGGTRFAEATAHLEADARGLPALTTQVLAVGGPTRALLQPGEDRLLLSRRLEGVRPVRAPARMAAVIRALAEEAIEPLTLRVYGRAPLPAAATLPENVTVLRATPFDGKPGSTWGVTALGMAEAASGLPNAVDVLVEMRGPPDRVPGQVVLAWAGTSDLESGALEPVSPRESDRAGQARWRFADLKPDGREVAVLTGDDPGAYLNPPDAWLRLPDRPLLRVAVAEPLRPFFAALLEADPGLVAAQGEADVAIVDGGSASDVPALFVVSAAEAEHAIAVTDPDTDAERLLATVQEDLSLAEIDGAALASATGRVISVGASAGERRAITLWRGLLAPDAGFVESRAFPLFVAKALRWLADQAPLHPFVAAGEPLPSARAGSYRDLEGRVHDAVGAEFTPPVAGIFRGPRGANLSPSLLDPSLYQSRAAEASGAGAPAAPFSLVTLLILAVFALLGAEWMLYRSGRVP